MSESLKSKFSISLDCGIGTITFNEPEKLNPFTHPVLQALGEYLQEMDCDPNVKVIVITGKGRYFSAGTDFRAKVVSNNSKEGRIRLQLIVCLFVCLFF
jgi:enoyl-CoA hydratase/carnithine racemase